MTPTYHKMSICSCLIAALAATPILRADFVWDGTGLTDQWIDGENWVGGAAPPFDIMDNLVFSATGAAQSPDAGADDWTSILSIAFTGANASLTVTGSGTLSLVDGATITNDSTIDQLLDVRIIANGGSLVLDAQTAALAFGRLIDLSDDAGAGDGVTLIVQGDNDTDIDGTIRGAEGSLVKNGTGTLTITRFNTYTGGTTLNGGTIVLGNNRSLGTGVLTVSSAGTIESDNDNRRLSNDVVIDFGVNLTIGGATDLDLRGVISGDGALRLDTDDDDTVITLRGENTYTGGTLLQQGTLRLADDAGFGTSIVVVAGDSTLTALGARTISNDVGIAGGVSLTLGGTSAMTLDGLISGTGGLIKDDESVVTLTATNTYTGLTQVIDGELLVEGSITSSVDVSGGLLGGTGSMTGQLTNLSGGTVDPGVSGIGTFTVTGDYDQQAESTLAVDLSASDGTSDLLDVIGAVTLDADSTITATVAGDGFITSGQTFTVIQATGGITDNGAEVTTGSATTTVMFVGDADVGDGTYELMLTRAANAYEAAATNRNNGAIGRALDGLQTVANANPAAEAGVMLGRLDALESDSYNEAVNQLSPEAFNSVATAGFGAVKSFAVEQAGYLAARRLGVAATVPVTPTRRPIGVGSLGLSLDDPALLATVFSNLQDDTAPADEKTGRWSNYVKLQGVFSDQQPTTNRTGFRAATIGGQVGFDYGFSDDFIGGIALGYLFTNADLADERGEIQDNAVRLGPYWSWSSGDFFLDGSVTFGYHFYEGRRKLPLLGLEPVSRYDGIDLSGYIGAGYHFEIEKNVYLTPSLGVVGGYYMFDGFNEIHGGAANLSVDDREAFSLRGRFTANLSAQVDWGWRLYPYVFLGYEHEFAADEEIEAAFVMGGSPFMIDTGNRSTGGIVYGGGVNVLLADGLSGFFRVEGVADADTDATGFAAGVSISF